MLYGPNGDLISGAGLGQVYEVPASAIHGERDFIIKIREKMLKYEKILKAIRHKNTGMMAVGYTPEETAMAEYKMLTLLDHNRGILAGYGVYE